MKIGELARAAQCTTETVRFYEREGLLPQATRTASNYRRYGPEQVERLRFIRNCRGLDMTHGEIRVLLGLMDAPPSGCGAVNAVLDEHIGHVKARIKELVRLARQLGRIRQQCRGEQALNACGILNGLVSLTSHPNGERHTHLE